jgi:hypothetical protein
MKRTMIKRLRQLNLAGLHKVFGQDQHPFGIRWRQPFTGALAALAPPFGRTPH